LTGALVCSVEHCCLDLLKLSVRIDVRSRFAQERGETGRNAGKRLKHGLNVSGASKSLTSRDPSSQAISAMPAASSADRAWRWTPMDQYRSCSVPVVRAAHRMLRDRTRQFATARTICRQRNTLVMGASKAPALVLPEGAARKG
jgi:hypothetical protein